MRVLFGPWTPDLPDLDSSGLEEAINCVPLESGYGSVRENSTVTGTTSAPLAVNYTSLFYNALVTGNNMELYVGTTGNGNVHVYRYVWSGTAFRATMDRTASYNAAASWTFARFGNNVLAANGFDAMQVAEPTYSAGGKFRDMSASASAPAGVRCLASVRDFVFAAGETSATNRVRWCQINNPQRWTPSPRLQSDYQDLPDTGDVIAMTGGDFAAVFTERSIWRATYVGSPIIFRFDEVAPGVACVSRRSCARFQNLTFFLSRSGFQIFDGQQCIPIGQGKIDRAFLDGLDSGDLSDVVGEIDPHNRFYVVSPPDRSKMYVYAMGTQAWTTIAKPHHFITRSIRLGNIFDTVALANRLGVTIFTDDTTDANLTEFMSSSYLTATFSTGEAQPFTDHRAFVRGVRPLIQGDANTSITVQVGKRNRLTETVSYGSAVSVNANGLAPLRAGARYLRSRVNISGGFERAIGFELDAIQSGRR
jgi:hypothetical protein